MTEAGFAVEWLAMEGAPPERAVTHSCLLGSLDDLASGVVTVD